MVSRLFLFALMLFLLAAPSLAEQKQLTLASTTSTDNSGLFQYLLPLFTADTGIAVRVIAVGTGQAIRLGMKGDADILLVHHPESEQRFVSEGYGTRRLKVMFNDFVLIGPADDPAAIAGSPDAATALLRIVRTTQGFTSRGDESGTHKAERALWLAAGHLPDARVERWYRETGAGMGATLNTAVDLNAYVLSDRATWLGFANKRGHRVLFEGDPRLFNQYAVIPVNPLRHPHVRAEAADEFAEWLVSTAGQTAIASFRIHNSQVFHPNAD